MLVVGREGIQAGQQLVHELLLAEQGCRVGGRLVADRRLESDGGGGAAEGTEAVGGHDCCLCVHAVDQLADRVPLRVGQALGGVRSDQVGAADAAEEQRAACEHGAVLAVGRHGVGHVVRGVARGVHDAPRHRAGLEGVAVAHLCGGELVVVPDRDHVGGTEFFGEHEPAGHVVVVHVGLHHVGDGPVAIGEDGVHTVDVALGVHHDGGALVADDVGAVAQVRGFDDEDLRGAHQEWIPSVLAVTTGKPLRCHISVPPSTLIARMPWWASHITTCPERLPVRQIR